MASMEEIPFVFGFDYLLRRHPHIDYAPAPHSSMHVLAIIDQHVALLAAVTFVVQGLSAVPMLFRKTGQAEALVPLPLRPGSTTIGEMPDRHDLRARGLIVGYQILSVNCTK